MRKVIGLIVILIVASVSIYFLLPRQSHQSLVLYSADAYTGEVETLAKAFHDSTGLPLPAVKGGGSFALAREISQGNPANVFFSVALNAYTPSYMGSFAPGWAIAIASDQMVIAYSNSTLSNPNGNAVVHEFKQAISTNDSRSFYRAFLDLTSGVVKVGISNPNEDPAGFRGWLVLEMAGSIYANSSNFFVQRLLRDSGNVTGPNAAALVSPLEEGQIQFLLIYKSAAISKGLNFIQLPPWLNLGNVSYSSFYQRFSYNLSTGPVRGSPILLFVSVPSHAQDYAEALGFVEFTVKHASLLSVFGLTPLNPALLFNDTALPSQLSTLLSGGEVKEAGGI
jgi:molybdate/tungstate transport system substrate-binding protein